MYTAEELNDIGAMLLSRGEVELAIEALGQAYSKDTRNPTIICNLANAYASNDDIDLAKDYFELALTIDENIFQANHSLGFILFKQKDYLEAIKYLEKALSINSSEDLIINLAFAYRNISSEKSRIFFEMAVENNLTDVALQFALTNVYLDSDDYENAETNLIKIIKKFPDYKKAYTLLNFVYMSTLQWNEQAKLVKTVEKNLKSNLKSKTEAVIEEPLMHIFRVDDPKTNLAVAKKKMEELMQTWN